MSNFISLTCPTCGGKLEVTEDADRFVCIYCGNEHLIDPGEKVSALSIKVKELERESTIKRFQSDIEELNQKKTQVEQAVLIARNRQSLGQMKRLGVLLLIFWLACKFISTAIEMLTTTIGPPVYVSGIFFLVAGSIALFLAILLIRRGFLNQPKPELADNEQLKEIVRIDRHIAQKQRDLEKQQNLSATHQAETHVGQISNAGP
jgi:hypothetical protein